jgi:hypothetical protein
VINILDATTLQWVTQARIESRGGVADFSWWQNGQGLAIAGKNGEVTEWSVDEGVIGRWKDEGAVVSAGRQWEARAASSTFTTEEHGVKPSLVTNPQQTQTAVFPQRPSRCAPYKT